MTSIQEIRLRDDEQYGLPTGTMDIGLTLRCRLSERLTPGTLVVESSGQLAREIPRFVPIALQQGQGTEVMFEGRLNTVISDGEDGCALLLGDQEIVRVDFKTGNMDPVCRLNRRETDDRGFYTLHLELLPDSVLVIYEGGAVRIDLAGKVQWHTHLAWDDIFETNKRLQLDSGFSSGRS